MMLSGSITRSDEMNVRRSFVPAATPTVAEAMGLPAVSGVFLPTVMES
jgi:hypothetical protein